VLDLVHHHENCKMVRGHDSIWKHCYAVTNTLNVDVMKPLLEEEQYKVICHRSGSGVNYINKDSDELELAIHNMKNVLVKTPYNAVHASKAYKRVICCWCFKGGVHTFISYYCIIFIVYNFGI
jgi:hypothetical protein